MAGGRSNLTFKVDDAERPSDRAAPATSQLGARHRARRRPRAQDHQRARARQRCPCPTHSGAATTRSVNGSPFYVMSFVDGIIVRDVNGRARAHITGRPARSWATRSSTCSPTCTAVDPDDVGLGDLGRKEGYIERQLKRWSTQFEASTTRDLPLVKEVHRRLGRGGARSKGPATIAHGDYRLDNCICEPEGRSRRCSTGSSARSATRWPISGCS